MDFKLENGPWDTLFEGTILGYDVEVLGGASSNLISIIYEKSEGKRVSAVIELFRVLHVKGDIEGFVETLPRKIVSLINHSKDDTSKFLIVDSDVSFVNYDSEEINREISHLMEKIERYANVIREVSRAYQFEATEINKCSEEIQQSFYGMPIVSLLISPKISTKRATSTDSGQLSIGEGEIILGITKKGQPIRNPLSFFSKTSIIGGQFEDRIRVMQVMIESAILSGYPAIVLDFSGSFERINYPNANKAQLKDFGLDYDPLGVPFNSTNAEKIKIDLTRVNIKGLLDLFGVTDEAVKKIINYAFEGKDFATPKEAEPKIIGTPLSEDLNEFKKNKALRIMRLINSRYKGIFGKSPDVSELLKGWMKGLGRASILRFNANDMRLNTLLIESLTSALITEFSTTESKTQKAFLFLQKADTITPQLNATLSHQGIISALVRGTEKGLYFAVEAKDFGLLHEKIKLASDAKISIISGNDVGITLKDKQSFRVLLRPGISEFTLPAKTTSGAALQASNQHNPSSATK